MFGAAHTPGRGHDSGHRPPDLPADTIIVCGVDADVSNASARGGVGHVGMATSSPFGADEVRGQDAAATSSSATRAGCSRKSPWSAAISTTSAPTEAAITRWVSGGTRVSAVVRM